MNTETARLIDAARAARAREFAALAAAQDCDAWPYTYTDAGIASLVEDYGYRLDINATWSQANPPAYAGRISTPYPRYRLEPDGLWHRVR